MAGYMSSDYSAACRRSDVVLDLLAPRSGAVGIDAGAPTGTAGRLDRLRRGGLCTDLWSMLRFLQGVREAIYRPPLAEPTGSATGSADGRKELKRRGPSGIGWICYE